MMQGLVGMLVKRHLTTGAPKQLLDEMVLDPEAFKH